MSGIIRRPKMPAMPEPVKPPTVDDAAKAEEDMLRLRRRRGLASTFLVGRTGRGQAAQSLLGAGTAGYGPGMGGGGGGGGGGTDPVALL